MCSTLHSKYMYLYPFLLPSCAACVRSWVRRELHCWVYDNVRAKWPTVVRRPSRLPGLFSGYHAPTGLVHAVLRAVGVRQEDLAAETTAIGVRIWHDLVWGGQGWTDQVCALSVANCMRGHLYSHATCLLCGLHHQLAASQLALYDCLLLQQGSEYINIPVSKLCACQLNMQS
jgi:hypothetical protein